MCKWYILPIGGLYGTAGENQETAIDPGEK